MLPTFWCERKSSMDDQLSRKCPHFVKVAEFYGARGQKMEIN